MTRLVAVIDPDEGRSILVESLPLLAVVDNTDRPVRNSDGSVWVTPSLDEAREMLGDRDGTEPEGDDLRAGRWRIVVVR